MPASREFIVIRIRAFYAATHLNGSVARVISSGSTRSSFGTDSGSLKTDSLRSLMAPHETGNIARLQGLEREFFAPRGGCVVRCLAYHARSFD